MLANVRFCFLLTFSLALAVILPCAAQIQGVQPPASSFAHWGSTMPTPSGLWGSTMPTSGIRASGIPLGSNGYAGSLFIGNTGSCCANFYWPYGSAQGQNPGTSIHHRHHHHDGNQTLGPVAVPAYIPYGVPYAVDSDDDAADDQDASNPEPAQAKAANREMRVEATSANGIPDKNSDTSSANDSDYDAGDDSASMETAQEAAPEKPEEPVVVQPSTVLVFKDGHRSDVVNYAIVGDTLFDFAGGRAHKILLADLDLPATVKANDDQGVEFKLPIASN